MFATSSKVKFTVCDVSPLTRNSYPFFIPTISRLEITASMTAAEITLLMPGAGPPPTRTPIRPRLIAIQYFPCD